MHIARHLCNQSEMEKQIQFYIGKTIALQAHELQMYKLWISVVKSAFNIDCPYIIGTTFCCFYSFISNLTVKI